MAGSTTGGAKDRDLAAEFTRFATLEARGASPLYERLALGVAKDGDLLALAARGRPEQPAPNLLFAAVHLLLIEGARHELAAFYPSVSGTPAAGDPLPAFRAFCGEHADAITAILQERRVQTNVVERCGLLLPAFGAIAERSGGKPLHLVEVGASAGLNLLWDQYRYDYGSERRCGPAASPVVIETELRGGLAPPVPEALPAIAARTGIDLNPIDVRVADAVRWLRALVWPEEGERLSRLDAAVALARQHPPTVLAGDALDIAPQLLCDAPPGETLCVYPTHTLNQFSPEARKQFAAMLAEVGATRDLYWLSSEYRPVEDGGIRPTLTLVGFQGGSAEEQVLAYCDHHGRWLEWLAPGQ